MCKGCGCGGSCSGDHKVDYAEVKELLINVVQCIALDNVDIAINSINDYIRDNNSVEE